MLITLRYKKQHELQNLKLRWIKFLEEYLDLMNHNDSEASNQKLSSEERARWSRQILFNLVNQKKIRDTKIALFGCGGIGSNVLVGLCYSGAYNYKLVDCDKIELSNLNRQTLYDRRMVGEIKVFQAKKHLLKINPRANVEAFNMKLEYPKDLNLLRTDESSYPNGIDQVDRIIKWADYIVNAVDYAGAPYLINDLCVKNHKPYYWGGVSHFTGDIYAYRPGNPCFRCIFAQLYDLEKVATPFLKDIIDKIDVYRYKIGGDMPGANIGTTVIAIGNFIAQMILNDIIYLDYNCKDLSLRDTSINIRNSELYGYYIVYNSLNFEILKIKIDHDKKCDCQKYAKSLE